MLSTYQCVYNFHIASGIISGKSMFILASQGICMEHCLCLFLWDRPVGLEISLRVVCLILLTLARGGTYIVEQPGSSLLRYYDRFDWLCMQTTESCLYLTIYCMCIYIYGNVSLSGCPRLYLFNEHKPVSGHSHIYIYMCMFEFPMTNFYD